MAYAIGIETSGKSCSVGLFYEENCVQILESPGEKSHAELLAIITKDILALERITTKELKYIAVSHGPGSYTGLRIGASFAKGLSYALDIPLISVDTTYCIALALQKKQISDYYIPLIDARRNEVYAQVFDSRLSPLEPIKAVILNPSAFAKYSNVSFGGDACTKWKEQCADKKNKYFLEEDLRSAKYLSIASYEKYQNGNWENTAYYEPNYLKQFTGR
tara:strand:+ start:207 stop:863 length:657 start_codon:yes stop_codon:yes gene_type:complete